MKTGMCILGLVLGWVVQLSGQNLQPGQAVDTAAFQWPRFFSTNGYEFAIYQPQITSWSGNQLEGRIASAVRPAGTSNESYGVIFFKTRTEVDKINRLVTLEGFQVTKINFPTEKGMQPQYLEMIRSFQPKAAKIIPLDHLEAVFAASSESIKVKEQQVKNDPPHIIYTTEPSLLILVDGTPIVKPLNGDYQRVVNTRSVLLWNTNAANHGYYLFAASRWYRAPSLDGPWSVPVSPPADIQSALQAAVETKQVDVLAPKDPNAAAPVLNIYISTVPAELLETKGPANLLAVLGTELLYVANTDQAVFYYLDQAQYYVLISGRWFKSASLYGPWTFVSPGQLPADFQRIPADHEKSNVLPSVPGTPQAQEAVIANSIPQTATIERSQVKLQVDYVGAPSFSRITGTPLYYAVNTVTPVIKVDSKTYYACQGGVWFLATGPAGPWMVATSVPKVVYTIPPSCPIHYVTYAYVYGYTPTVVYVGYTPGYAGTVVAPGGVVVYGTGYYYPPVVVGTTYVSYPPTYGYGASMALGAAVGFAFGFAAGANSTCWCEPHWGPYAVVTPYSYAHVNVNATSFYTQWGTAVHATGSYGYNAYTGTQWGSQHASTFNPYTGTSGNVARGAAYNPYTGTAAAARGGSWYNPYSGATAQASGGASGNRYTGNYDAGRQGSAYNPSTGARASGQSSISGNAYSGQYSGERQGGGYNPATGRYGAGETTVSGNAKEGTASVSSQGVAGSTKSGNQVAWKNGNMYADKSGNMYSYNKSSGVQQYNKSSGSWQSASRSSESWASHQSSAQSLGSQRFSGWQHSGGGGWGGFHGGRR
jgi:hypothetical protein